MFRAGAQAAIVAMWVRVVLGLALASAAGIAPADETQARIREAALSQMLSEDAAERMGACAALGEVGEAGDLPSLMAGLFDPDAGVRQAAEGAIWRVWGRSGDPAVDRLFSRGVGQLRERKLASAAQTFSRVIEMRPDFAEGWNKRATVYFLLGEDDLSRKDCDEVLRRNPVHFGALAGYGQIYVRKGEFERALKYFERALVINPNLEGVRASIEAIEKALAARSRRYI